jgi:tellurite methyltransferase
MRRTDTSPTPGRGGYDEGYLCCSQFWGAEPGSLVRRMFSDISLDGQLVLDVGCGDGKNAIWLASRGARVLAVDVSRLAINRATTQDPERRVAWAVADATALPLLPEARFDAVVAYGLLHCLPDEGAVHEAILNLQALTKEGGLHLTVTFNSRDQGLGEAHPGFRPTLLPHNRYVDAYGSWGVVEATDELLHETHPHNGIPHHHSMTRIIARKPS